MLASGELRSSRISNVYSYFLTLPTNFRLPVEPFWAAVVFIDISGFSSLASDLQKEEEGENPLMSPGGKGAGSGAENLTAFLNYTLRQLIDVVLLHGGDIVKFAGDAMIVVFRPTDENGKGTR
jgi:hypothetical protein